VVVLLTGILSAAAIPMVTAAAGATRVRGTARLVATRCGLARAQAVARHASVGVVISADDDAVWLSTFQDSNGNGVRTAEVRDGTDAPVDRPSALVPTGAGIDVAVNDPLAPLRTSDRALLSFSPTGTASSASVYLSGRDGTRFAVRVLGATGRVRIQRLDTRTGQWLDQF
jgi:Tfp pilus assembly protein FimT